MLISKSEYMLYLKHPAWLWIKKHEKRLLPPIDEALQARFDEGHAFEPFVESLYPNLIRLGFNNYSEYLEMPDKTAEAWDNGAQEAPAVGLSNDIWNSSIQTDIIQNLGQTCNVQFQSITNPVLKSYIPPKEKCDWAKSPPKCANDDDCSKWATTNCQGKNFVENYCKDNGYCHFKI